ncbi:glycosyltransferase family 2 protein [Desulfovibrio sp. JC010]|uniref:glycosyltransferase family 2 protein n=1 Tax=Desulfovibrio sp. JC010 TaxID=2593641 RepID=UPI0013D77F67|nr:glycosyltransferase family 2 protein [Desulfovibrio sp. JC010]
MDLSIIIPMRNEEKNVAILHQEITEAVFDMGLTYEVIYINDGSTDKTGARLQELEESDKHVLVIEFKKNYGQTAALRAGFNFCKGEKVITLDGDLQNDPADIPMMLDKLDEGYDLVNGWRKDRHDDLFTRKIPSMAANKIINRLIEGTGVRINDYGCSLKAYRHEIVKDLNLYGEMHRFIPVFAAWFGSRIVEIPVNHRPRLYGTTKYNLSRVSTVLLDLLVVRFFSDFLTRPIQFFGKIASKVFLLGVILTMILGMLNSFSIMDIDWGMLTMIMILTGLGSFQIVVMGLVGEMQIRSYFEMSRQDTYVIRRVTRR